MPRDCSVCAHDQREEIDAAIVAGESSARAIARQWHVSRSAVGRHRPHISNALVAVLRRREAAGAETLVDRVERLYERASAILDAAEAEGRPTVALGALRELRGIVETLGKLTGELDERPTVNVLNLVQSTDWQQLRARLLDALAPFPDVRAVVATRLLEIEAS